MFWSCDVYCCVLADRRAAGGEPGAIRAEFAAEAEGWCWAAAGGAGGEHAGERPGAAAPHTDRQQTAGRGTTNTQSEKSILLFSTDVIYNVTKDFCFK